MPKTSRGSRRNNNGGATRNISKPTAPVNSNKNGCQFCFTDDGDEFKLGKLYTLDKIRVHYYCLLFCSALLQTGKYDHQGILGFMPKDITAEIRRGRRLRCCYCKMAGATLGCCQKKCPKAYHLPCGLKNGIMLQFFGTFPTFCKDHRFYQTPIPWRQDVKVACSICFEDIVPRVSENTLYPPCCKNGWFHKDCVQMQALQSGYFFRCPLCNNQTEFTEEMQKFEIRIPEQDASWETDPGAFSELNVMYSHCDALKCLCPEGRDHNSVDESPWDITVCDMCGSHGTHIRCSKLNLSDPKWICTTCKPKDHPASTVAVRKKRKFNVASTSSSSSSVRTRSHTQNTVVLSETSDSVRPNSEERSSTPSSSIRTRSHAQNTAVLSETSDSVRPNSEERSSTPVPTSSNISCEDAVCNVETKVSSQEKDIKHDTASDASRSSSPISISSEDAHPIGQSHINVFYREKQFSPSDSNSSDNDQVLEFLRLNKESSSNSPFHQNQNIFANSILKRPASFSTCEDTCNSSPSMKKPYLPQTRENPFGSSVGSTLSQGTSTQSNLLKSYDKWNISSTTVLENVNAKLEGNVSKACSSYSNISKYSQEVIVLSDSDEEIEDARKEDKDSSFSWLHESKISEPEELVDQFEDRVKEERTSDVEARKEYEDSSFSWSHRSKISEPEELVDQLEDRLKDESSQSSFSGSALNNSNSLCNSEANFVPSKSTDLKIENTFTTSIQTWNELPNVCVDPTKLKQTSLLKYLPNYKKQARVSTFANNCKNV